jgi:hypothetical protein
MTRFTLTSTLVLGLTAASLAFLSEDLHAQLAPTGIVRKGYRIASYGKIDTDLQFSEFFSSAHTISAWVMPEFTKNWYSPILSNAAGTFFVGQGDYDTGNGGYLSGGVKKVPECPVLRVNVGATQALYRWCNYERRKWNHIAVVRAPMLGFPGWWEFRLYVDGARLSAFNRVQIGSVMVNGGSDPIYQFNPAADVVLSNAAVSGTLRFGSVDDVANRYQFYGLIDEVAVYNKAMSAAEVSGLMNAPISGSHPNLVAGYTFDNYSLASVLLPPQMTRPITPNNRAYSVLVQLPHNDSNGQLFDDVSLVSPSATSRRLPFPPGTEWQVGQEFDAALSHNGSAAFCWDFHRVDAPSTDGFVIAAASGTVVNVVDVNDGSGPQEKVHVEVVPGLERDTYIHLDPGSFDDAYAANYPNNPPLLWEPDPASPFTWTGITAGYKVGKIWPNHPNGPHLHFCSAHALSPADVNAIAPATTMPVAFIDYATRKWNANTNSFGNWQYVARGMPRFHDQVRRWN